MANYINIYPSLELQEDSGDFRDRDSQGDTHPVNVTNADSSDFGDRDSRGDTHPVIVTNAASFKTKRLYPDLSGLLEHMCPTFREQESNTGVFLGFSILLTGEFVLQEGNQSQVDLLTTENNCRSGSDCF